MALTNDIFDANSQTKKNGALEIRLNMKSNLWHRTSNEPNYAKTAETKQKGYKDINMTT